MPSLRSLLLFAILVAAILPATAQAPTVEQMVTWYTAHPWIVVQATIDGKPAALHCALPEVATGVDRMISILVRMATGIGI